MIRNIFRGIKKIKGSTPIQLDESIVKLWKMLDESQKYKPIFLDLELENYSKVNDCFPNVLKIIEDRGGSLQHGWTIWEHNHFIEAEFHGVWKDVNGFFHDITPKLRNEKRILFIPVDNRKWENFIVPNVRIRTHQNILTEDLIGIFGARDDFYHQTSKVWQDKPGGFLPAKVDSVLNQMATGVMSMLYMNRGLYDGCFCRSGNPYIYCCQKSVHDAVESLPEYASEYCERIKRGQIVVKGS